VLTIWKFRVFCQD